MIASQDVGGVHVKYLYHCPRQLWLYARGLRPERFSPLVEFGEAIDDTTFTRATPIDLGSARIDFVDGESWVHEVKSSTRSTEADRAQLVHYCYRLRQVGVAVAGGRLHYPTTRRTVRILYDEEGAAQAERDITSVLVVIQRDNPPQRLQRSRCRGCSYFDYCWTE